MSLLDAARAATTGSVYTPPPPTYRPPTTNPLLISAQGGAGVGPSIDVYGSNGLDITGALPTDTTQQGAGLAIVRDPTLQGLTDYYLGGSFGTSSGTNNQFTRATTGGYDRVDLGNIPVLQNYIEETYFDEGNAIPGTSIGNLGQLNQALFGSPYDWQGDYSNFTGDKLLSALGPQGQTILENARDWEIREVERGNQSTLGDNVGGLLGAAGGAAILAPAVLTGGGLIGGGGFVENRRSEAAGHVDRSAGAFGGVGEYPGAGRDELCRLG